MSSLVDVDWNLLLYDVRLGYMDWHRSFNGDGIWLINAYFHPLDDRHLVGHLHWVRYRPVYLVGDWLFNVNWVRLVHVDGIGPVDWNPDGHWHLSLHVDRVWVRNGNGVGDDLLMGSMAVVIQTASIVTVTSIAQVQKSSLFLLLLASACDHHEGQNGTTNLKILNIFCISFITYRFYNQSFRANFSSLHSLNV